MSFNKVNSDGSLTRVAGGTLYADAPVGAIMPYGGTTAPDGWFLCRGQAVSRTTYAELFKVIGTAFGAGDGSTTFNLPDLREATTKGIGLSGKSSNHFDADGVALGEFVEDRVKTHQHTYSGNTGDMSKNATGYMYPVGFTSDETPGHLGNITQIQNGRGMWRAQGTSKDVVEGYSVYIDVSHTHGFSGTTDEAGGATTEVKAIGVNYIIKAAQVGVPADFAPVDTIESGNMKAVTSNAVAEAIEAKLFTGSATKSAYVTAGDITWQWTGRICRVLFEGVKIAANTPFLSDICTGLPPSNGTEFLTVCAEYPTTTAAGFLRADRNIGKLLADASVGGQTVEVTLYASVSYITSEDAHQI